VFGISTSIPGLRSGEHVNVYGDGFCVITFHGKDGCIFWFIIEKLHKKFTYPNAPRFTPEDASHFCGRLTDVPVWKDVTVGDLWRKKTVASMTALEEGLLSTWFFDRLVLLGDSVHKVSPLLNLLSAYSCALDDPKYRTRSQHRDRGCCSIGIFDL
jgi:FAD dependent monooxygenase